MTEIKKAVIYGASGFGREIHELMKRDLADQFEVIAFVDDALDIDEEVNGIQVVQKDFLKDKELSVVIGIADTGIKLRLYKELSAYQNLQFPNIISKHAIVNPDAQLGEGVVITDFCWISTNVKIGNMVAFNVGTVIGHDSVIGDGCSFMTQCDISGHVTVGKGTYFGAKTFILQGLNIGKNVKTAAGSVAINNIKDNAFVSGNFAIPHEKHLMADAKDKLAR